MGIGEAYVSLHGHNMDSAYDKIAQQNYEWSNSLLGQPKSLLSQAPFMTLNYRLGFRRRQRAYHCLFLSDRTSSVSVLLKQRASRAAMLLGCEHPKWRAGAASYHILGTDSNGHKGRRCTRRVSLHLPHPRSANLARRHTTKHSSMCSYLKWGPTDIFSTLWKRDLDRLWSNSQELWIEKEKNLYKMTMVLRSRKDQSEVVTHG